MVPECIRSGNLFLWGTVICSFLDLDVGVSGAAFPDIEAPASGGRFDDVVDNHPQDPPPVQLNGTLGQSISMVLKVPPGKNISKIKWEYESRGRKSRIATVANGGANLTDPSNGFGQRLEIVNQTTLRIVDLKADDRGIYTAEVQFDTAETQSQKFALNVSDKSDVGSYTCLFFPYCRTSLAIIIYLYAFVIVVVCLYLRHRWAKMKGSNEVAGSLARCPPLPDQKTKEKTPTKEKNP